MVPLEHALQSETIIAQSRARLMNAFGRERYVRDPSKEVEISSFFLAAWVSAQDDGLMKRFAGREGERAKSAFASELPSDRAELMAKCYDVRTVLKDGSYEIPFEDFLMATSKYGIAAKLPMWKLSYQDLEAGKVFMDQNRLAEFFGELSKSRIIQGVKGLRKAKFSEKLRPVLDAALQYIPPPRPRKGKGYLWIERLLEMKVTDGRHRLLWIVLAPYLINVKNDSDDKAEDALRDWAKKSGAGDDIGRTIKYDIRRSRRTGLMPPTIANLKTKHRDIYDILPVEIREYRGNAISGTKN